MNVMVMQCQRTTAIHISQVEAGKCNIATLSTCDMESMGSDSKQSENDQV